MRLSEKGSRLSEICGFEGRKVWGAKCGHRACKVCSRGQGQEVRQRACISFPCPDPLPAQLLCQPLPSHINPNLHVMMCPLVPPF